MLDKRECIKIINNNIEKLLDNLIEILALLKVTKGNKIEEISSLVFAKKRISEFTESVDRIFQNLVYLKLIHKNSQVERKDVKSVFNDYFKDLNKNYTFS